MILDDIVAKKRIRLQQAKQSLPFDELANTAADMPVVQKDRFKDALKSPGLSVIAEVKKASPSKGIISSDFKPVETAMQYETCGASAVSVLTEEDFFLGSSEYLKDIKRVVTIPLLRKDFIIDVWQVYESKLIGADAILLIAAILSDSQLREYRQTAQMLGMCALVETHDEKQMQSAIDSGAEIIGINNRNLKTFEVSLETSQKLIKMIPSGKTIVSESGIMTAEDARFVHSLGADAVLVGESLMKSQDIGQQLAAIKKAGV